MHDCIRVLVCQKNERKASRQANNTTDDGYCEKQADHGPRVLLYLFRHFRLFRVLQFLQQALGDAFSLLRFLCLHQAAWSSGHESCRSTGFQRCAGLDEKRQGCRIVVHHSAAVLLRDGEGGRLGCKRKDIVHSEPNHHCSQHAEYDAPNRIPTGPVLGEGQVLLHNDRTIFDFIGFGLCTLLIEALIGKDLWSDFSCSQAWPPNTFRPLSTSTHVRCPT
mmetsp:Transcript_41468/g.95326  ORF Transcript_41468/g.95326 Transcript_41468/m.95326 type:complete len:220 (+) Transcript_41468:1186-1845(+)